MLKEVSKDSCDKEHTGDIQDAIRAQNPGILALTWGFSGNYPGAGISELSSKGGAALLHLYVL